VRELVGDDIGDVLLLHLGGGGRIDEEQRLAERDAADVLHRAGREVGQGEQVDLPARVGDPVVVLEPLEGERADLEPEGGEVALARDVDDAQRHTADVDRFGGLEVTDHHRHEVRRHHDRVLEPDRHLAVLGALARGLGAVRHRHQFGVDHEREAEHRLQLGLVPAREGAPAVGGLHLAGRDHLLVAVGVDVGGAVPAAQTVVEDAGEHHLDRHLAGAELGREGEGAELVLLVEHHRGRVGARRRLHLGRGDLQLGGVAHEHVGGLVHVEPDGHVAAEGGCLEIGFEQHVVAIGGGRLGKAARTVRHGRSA
jgi:hypothetical protein